MRSCDTCSPCLADCRPSLHGRRINHRQLVVSRHSCPRERTTQQQQQQLQADIASRRGQRSQQFQLGLQGQPLLMDHLATTNRQKEICSDLWQTFLNTYMYFFWSEIQLYKNCESCFVNLKNLACLVAYRYYSWEKMQKTPPKHCNFCQM